MNARSLLGLGLFVAGLIGSAHGVEYYVAVDGRADAAGTRDDAWDIVSMFAGQRPVKPSDTVWLRGGTYRCEDSYYRTKAQGYNVALSGAADQPITIRAAIGERVTIDGGMVVQGDYLRLWDLDIAQPDDLPRVTQEGGSHPDLGNPYGGITVHGNECRLINLVVRNNLGNGIGWWSSAKGGEIHGCIIVRNGWKGPDRNHGHCIYTQNQDGTKTISNCIMTTRWPGGHYTMHAYGSSRAYVDNFVIEDNIAWRHGTFLVGGGRPSRNVVVRRNYLYKVPMQIGYSAPHNEGCEITENVLFRSGISVNRYKSGVVADNLVVDGRLSTSCEDAVDARANVTLNEQTPEKSRSILIANKYDQKRANLAVFNWRKETQVRVTAGSFLKDGERFRLMAPLDFYGKPAFEAKCEDGGFDIPMDDEFAVFVVLKR